MNKATADCCYDRGATTGTQIPPFWIAFMLTKNWFWKESAWRRRSQKSRAGFKAGPVGPPSDVTKAITRNPSAKWATESPEAVWSHLCYLIAKSEKSTVCPASIAFCFMNKSFRAKEVFCQTKRTAKNKTNETTNSLIKPLSCCIATLSFVPWSILNSWESSPKMFIGFCFQKEWRRYVTKTGLAKDSAQDLCAII